MTGDELDKAIRSRGFTQVGFAEWIGVSDRVVRVWVRDSPPPYVVRLVQFMLATYPERAARRQRNTQKTNVDTFRID